MAQQEHVNVAVLVIASQHAVIPADVMLHVQYIIESESDLVQKIIWVIAKKFFQSDAIPESAQYGVADQSAVLAWRVSSKQIVHFLHTHTSQQEIPVVLVFVFETVHIVQVRSHQTRVPFNQGRVSAVTSVV